MPTTVILDTAGAGTWTAPSRLLSTTVVVELVGGGGAGGGDDPRSGGGGGGATTFSTFEASGGGGGNDGFDDRAENIGQDGGGSAGGRGGRGYRLPGGGGGGSTTNGGAGSMGPSGAGGAGGASGAAAVDGLSIYGGGGAGGFDFGDGGGGGGGGGYSHHEITVTPGQSYTYAIGAGGVARGTIEPGVAGTGGAIRLTYDEAVVLLDVTFPFDRGNSSQVDWFGVGVIPNSAFRSTSGARLQQITAVDIGGVFIGVQLQINRLVESIERATPWAFEDVDGNVLLEATPLSYDTNVGQYRINTSSDAVQPLLDLRTETGADRNLVFYVRERSIDREIAPAFDAGTAVGGTISGSAIVHAEAAEAHTITPAFDAGTMVGAALTGVAVAHDEHPEAHTVSPVFDTGTAIGGDFTNATVEHQVGGFMADLPLASTQSDHYRFGPTAETLPPTWFADDALSDAQRALTEVRLYDDGQLRFQIGGANNSNLRNAWRPFINVTLSGAGRSVTVAGIGGSDTTDPYLWTPTNASEVAALYDAFAAPSNTAFTLRVEAQLSPYFIEPRFGNGMIEGGAFTGAAITHTEFPEAHTITVAFDTGTMVGGTFTATAIVHAEVAEAHTIAATFDTGTIVARNFRSHQVRRREAGKTIPVSFRNGAMIGGAITGVEIAHVETMEAFTITPSFDTGTLSGISFTNHQIVHSEHPEAFAISAVFGTGTMVGGALVRPDLLHNNFPEHFTIRPTFARGAMVGGPFTGDDIIVFDAPDPIRDADAYAAWQSRSLHGEQLRYALEINHSSLSMPIRIVADNVAHRIGGHTFTPLAFRARPPSFVEGEVPRATLEVDNVGKELTQWIEASSGGRGATMRVMQVVKETLVNVSYVVWELPALAVGVSEVSNNVVTIQLVFRHGRSRPGVKIRFDRTTAPGLYTT